jgi:hypothetical protein
MLYFSRDQRPAPEGYKAVIYIVQANKQKRASTEILGATAAAESTSVSEKVKRPPF